MALIKFREPNLARVVGVRPYHRGEQVFEHAVGVGIATYTLYTVPAGKTFYLTDWSFSVERSARSNYSHMAVYDNVPAVYRYLAYFVNNLYPPVTDHSLFYPIEISAGYSIRSVSVDAGALIFSYIHGWVE